MSDSVNQMYPCLSRYKLAVGAGGIGCTGNISAAVISATTIGTFAGLACTGNSTLGDASSDTCTVNAFLDIKNDCTIGEDATDDAYFNATEHHTGPENHEGAEAHIGNETHDGDETHTGDETHSGQEWHYGHVECSDTFSVLGYARLNGGGDLGNTRSDFVRLWGRLSVVVELVSLTLTIDSRDGMCADTIIIAATPAISSTLKFTAANCIDGMVKRIAWNNGTHEVTIQDDTTSGNLAVLSSTNRSCQICFYGGRWWLG